MKLIIIIIACGILGVMGWAGLHGDSNARIAGGKQFAEMLVVKITKHGIVKPERKHTNSENKF